MNTLQMIKPFLKFGQTLAERGGSFSDILQTSMPFLSKEVSGFENLYMPLEAGGEKSEKL